MCVCDELYVYDVSFIPELILYASYQVNEQALVHPHGGSRRKNSAPSSTTWFTSHLILSSVIKIIKKNKEKKTIVEKSKLVKSSCSDTRINKN